MRYLWRLSSLLAFASLASMTPRQVLAASHPETLPDILQMENVEGVEFDPGGKRIVFERIPKYEEMSSFGVESRQTAELYTYELGGAGKAHPLITGHGNDGLPEHLEGMWIAGFSPKGTRLAVYWLEKGATKAGVYEFATGRLLKFPFTPDLEFFGDSLAWLSEDELICSAMPEGEQPPLADWRRVSARRLAQAWEDAWAGKLTASVMESRTKEPDRSVPPGSLFKVDARTGATHLLGGGRFSDLSISPDAHYVAALQLGRLRQMNPDRPVDWVENPPGMKKQALLFDLKKGGAPVALFPEGEPIDHSFVWSSSADVLTFATSRLGTSAGGIYYLFDAKTGVRKPVPHLGLDLTSQRERGWQAVPDQAVPFGKGIVVPARAQSDPKAPPAFTQKDFFAKGLPRVDWYEVRPDGSSRNLTADLKDVSAILVSTSKQGIVIAADGALWRLSPGGQRKNLTATQPLKLMFARMFRAGGGEVADISSDVAVARAIGGVDAPYVFVDLNSGQTTTLAVPQYSGRMLAVSTAAKAAVMRGTGDKAWSLSLVTAGQEKPAPFWVFNEHLSEVQAPKKITLSYELANGKKVQCEALLPPDWIEGRRAPVAVWIYPNVSHYSSNSYYGFINTFDDALMASAGYIMLYPYSSEAELRTSDNPLGNWAAMVLPAVDALIKAGYADPNRLGTYGISQGSWSVLSLIEQTGRFKAAMAGYGVTDFVSEYGSMGIGRRLWPDDLFGLGESLRFEATAGTYPLIGASLLDDPARYVRASPLFGTRKIETPLLLLHTDLDVNFPMSQFDEMFIQLVRFRKEAQYVRYWGEEHGVKSPANVRDQWAHLLAWFDQWLDISRDSAGHMLYEGNEVSSRHGKAAMTPEQLLALKWFFGN